MPSWAHAGSRISSVDEALAFIHGLYRFGSVPGLDRIEYLLELAGNPQRGMKVVHVAGTNGKGSVTAMLSSILLAAGYCVGKYISPYIEEFGERITVNNRMLSDREILDGVRYLAPILEHITAEGREHPTEFEVVTALGFWHFAKSRVDLVALEVGLGGRADATNVVAPEDLKAAVITSIGFDHVAQLGPTLADIAREKAGIIKEERPVVCGVSQPAPRAVIATECKNKNAPMKLMGRDFSARQIAACLTGQAFTYEDDQGTLEKLVTPLVGAHQVSNAACCLSVVRLLNESGYVISDDAVRAGLRNVSWPARFEVVGTKPPIVIDIAHNIDGVTRLCQTVRELIGDRVILIAGMLEDKDITDMVRQLAGITDTAVVAAPHSPRALAARALGVQFESMNKVALVAANVDSAVDLALGLSGGLKPIVCAGSTYLAGPVRQSLRKRGIMAGRSCQY